MRYIIFILGTIFCSCTTYCQTPIVIKGIVIDRSGAPIPYCSVSVKGSRVSATTNECGEFELLAKQQEFTIVFNCMSTYDFVPFEKRFKEKNISKDEIILFQLKGRGKTNNKECQKRINKKLKKFRV
jgi:hypothetical protein